jgi:hypothetical protein
MSSTCNIPSNLSEAERIDYTRNRLNKEISYTYRILGIFVVIAGILLVMLVYCIIKIIGVILYFRMRKGEKEIEVKKALNKTGATFTLTNSDNDNEEYEYNQLKPNEYAEAKDEYYQFHESINKSLGEYKAYNDKVKNFFETTRDKAPPDQYDRRIFDIKQDNW